MNMCDFSFGTVLTSPCGAPLSTAVERGIQSKIKLKSPFSTAVEKGWG